MAEDLDGVRGQLAACDVVFHYGQPRDALRANWDLTANLRWVHVGGVGVDWALFDELTESDVVVTNSRGIFDTTLPEYLLALMLALVKDLPGTMRAQAAAEWRHRTLQPLSGGRVLILGAGSIARSAGRLLRTLGMETTLVGRSERDGAPGEGRIRAVAALHQLLPESDWLVVLTPLTPETRGLIGSTELGLLPIDARLVNIGRGPVVVERALIDALEAGALAGAALDVFEREPLRPDSPLWDMPNVIVSPHIGGDVADTPTAFGQSFVANLERYIAGQPLHNVVDKRLGYVTTTRR
jgi:phosphoglycerate dehydrogenase-like enzyme